MSTTTNTKNFDPDWRRFLVRETKGGVPVYKSCAANVRLILENGDYFGRFRLNAMSHEIEVRGRPWAVETPEDDDVVRAFRDEDAVDIKCALSATYQIETSDETIHKMVCAIARSNAYDPLLDYLASLKWDGTPRIDTWLIDHCGVEDDANQYARTVGRKWLIAAVARVRRPGCKADNVLILEGPQYAGKSAVLRTLASPAFFTDTPIDIGDKDARIAIQRYWIVELAELESLRKVEATRAKAFFSQNEDHFRPPYGRTALRFLRRCLFAGTSNMDTYLHDSSGNRRFWPVYCTKTQFDLAALAAVRDQIWAEAVTAFEAGEEWWLSLQQTQKFESEAAARTSEDMVEERIRTWMENNPGVFTNEEVCARVLGLDSVDASPSVTNRVGRAAALAKYFRRRLTTADGKQRWFYSKVRWPEKEFIEAAQVRREIAQRFLAARDRDERKEVLRELKEAPMPVIAAPRKERMN